MLFELPNNCDATTAQHSKSGSSETESDSNQTRALLCFRLLTFIISQVRLPFGPDHDFQLAHKGSAGLVDQRLHEEALAHPFSSLG